ncbi:hypothetical protein BV25DRAFT_419235 [Artomyces pyxidatus]|uniref:Uncharacterized protein n=1 Tax=Artomyces pyxidatus TaxID=48021 RepID=A0ACB8T5Z9_9AGAM|nr:hypothetical protein BV25DRAFT_419235 [Artomyces pyxidatus]
MPGPTNHKKKKKQPRKKGNRAKPPSSTNNNLSVNDSDFQVSNDSSYELPKQPTIAQQLEALCEQQDLLAIHPHHDSSHSSNSESPPHTPTDDESTLALLQNPIIFDAGSGPRVRDARAFISSYFAQRPCMSDPLCAEFAQPEVLQMLRTVLPEETALFMWYNKSRKTGRVCPACRRLYNLGDTLPNPLNDHHEDPAKKEPPPQLLSEQKISGLCSPLCFIMASFSSPGTIRSTWGRMAEDLDDATWELLDGAGAAESDHGLGMLLKMTRLHDLGLAQLCLPELGIDEEIYESSGSADSSFEQEDAVSA